MPIVNQCNKSGCKRNKQCENNDLYMKHPYNDAEFQKDIKNPEILIIGTTPPWRFTLNLDGTRRNEELLDEDKNIDFYYGAKKNNFWKIIRVISQKDLKDRDKILQFCKEKGWLFVDIINECYTNDKYSALDKNLCIKSFNATIFKIISASNIKIIYFTGESNAYKWFNSALQKNSNFEILEKFSEYPKMDTKHLPKFKMLKIKNTNKKIPIIMLPSPSGSANRGMSKTTEYYNNFKKSKNTKLNYLEWIYDTLLLEQEYDKFFELI